MAEKEAKGSETKPSEKDKKERLKEAMQKLAQKESEQIIAFPEAKKISMWIDDYNDLFSDFDPRDYSERAISDDFIIESQKRLRETKTGAFELRFLVPQSVRNEKEEAIIKKRLKGYFKGVEKETHNKIKKTVKTGIALTITGFVLMVISAFLLYIQTESLISKFIVVIIDPAGWFSVWYGLDQIFYNAAEKKKSYAFYKKISSAEIIFESY